MSQQPILAHKPIKRGAEAHSSEGIVPPLFPRTIGPQQFKVRPGGIGFGANPRFSGQVRAGIRRRTGRQTLHRHPHLHHGHGCPSAGL